MKVARNELRERNDLDPQEKESLHFSEVCLHGFLSTEL